MDPRERELEQLIDTRLRALPVPRAPITFAAAVLRRAAGRPRVGYSTWPRFWQASFVATLLAAIGAGLFETWTWSPSAAITRFVPSLAGVNQAIDLAGRGVALMHQATAAAEAFVLHPIVLGFVGLVLVMSAACVLFAVLLGRVANFPVEMLKGASQ